MKTINNSSRLRCFDMTAATKKCVATSVLARNLDSPVGTARVFAETKVTPKIRSMSLFFKEKDKNQPQIHYSINLVTEAVNPKHLNNPAKFYTVYH